MNTFQKIYNPVRPHMRSQYISSASRKLPSPPIFHEGEKNTYHFMMDEGVIFGEFFNSIFEDEIQTITHIENLTLKLQLKGIFEIRIHRVIPGVGSFPIVDLYLDTKGIKEVWEEQVELQGGKGSRLYFELISRSQNAILHNAEWAVDLDPKNKVKLCIVTTTFKNENLINKNIEYLLKSEEIKSYDLEVCVVDNAKTYNPTIKDDRLHLIQQENVGGAGGFTRGIYEVAHGVLKDEGITHILLMDDDIKLHLSSIIKIIKMYQYNREKSALGGCMLDMNRPNFLFEAGAFSCRNKPIGSHNDVEYAPANDFKNLDAVGFPTKYDYCGWWFFSFPVEAVNEIGLPKPVFIRGDDVDYGARLEQAGYRNYCLGGVGVWHLHFLEKPISWVIYYVFRNHLIMLSTSHRDRGWSKAEIKNDLQQTIFYNLCQYDYAHAALVLLAIEDFLKGPQFLKHENANEILQKVRTSYSQYNSKLDPEKVEIKYELKRDPDIKRINYLKKLTLNYQKPPYKRKTNRGFATIHGEFPPIWKHTPEENGYILIDPVRNVKRVFERRGKLARELNQRSIKVFSLFDEKFDQASSQYNEEDSLMHTKEYWEDFFTNNNCMKR